MAAKTTAFIVLALMLGFGLLAGTFIGPFINQLTVPSSHRQIVEKTTVKAKISDALPKAQLTISLVEAGNQEITALDIVDIARKARWVGQKHSYSLWKWCWKDEPLVFMRIWGPKDGVCLVEFSKMTMTEIYIDVAGKTHQFPLADKEFGGFEAYWWLYVTVT